MAYNFFSILAFLLILNILSISALAGRDIATKASKLVDKKLPESFIDHDGTVLVPGMGRYYIFPRPGTNFNPFTYNPVTGTSGGAGVSLPGSGSRSYIPGGDDTFVPNPGVEVPTGGSTPQISANP